MRAVRQRVERRQRVGLGGVVGQMQARAQTRRQRRRRVLVLRGARRADVEFETERLGYHFSLVDGRGLSQRRADDRLYRRWFQPVRHLECENTLAGTRKRVRHQHPKFLTSRHARQNVHNYAR